jgi:hypothetical protein
MKPFLQTCAMGVLAASLAGCVVTPRGYYSTGVAVQPAYAPPPPAYYPPPPPVYYEPPPPPPFGGVVIIGGGHRDNEDRRDWHGDDRGNDRGDWHGGNQGGDHGDFRGLPPGAPPRGEDHAGPPPRPAPARVEAPARAEPPHPVQHDQQNRYGFPGQQH